MTKNVVHIEPATRAEYWADRITKSHAACVEQIVQTGRELLAAKAKLPHGEWGRLTGRVTGSPLLPFSPQTAHKLMLIAQHLTLSNVAHWATFPASWRTLAVLAQLPAPTVEGFARSEVIHPELTRSDAEALVREWQAAQNTGTRPMFQPPQPAAPDAPPYAKPPEADPARIAALEARLSQEVAALHAGAEQVAAIHDSVRGVPAPQSAWTDVLDQINTLILMAGRLNLSFAERLQPLPVPCDDVTFKLRARLSAARTELLHLTHHLETIFENGASNVHH